MKYVCYHLFLAALLATWGCTKPAQDINISLNNKFMSNEDIKTDWVIDRIEIKNDQLLVFGKNLDKVTKLKVLTKTDNKEFEFQINTKSSSQIKSSPSKEAIDFSVAKLFDLVLSSAHASTPYTIHFDLCDAKYNNAQFSCGINLQGGEVLTYNSSTNKWEPQAPVKFAQYLGIIDLPSEISKLDQPGQLGDYYIAKDDANYNNQQVYAGNLLVRGDQSWDIVRTAQSVRSVNNQTGDVFIGINNLSDVDYDPNDDDGKFLKYDEPNQKWIAAKIKASDIEDLVIPPAVDVKPFAKVGGANPECPVGKALRTFDSNGTPTCIDLYSPPTLDSNKLVITNNQGQLATSNEVNLSHLSGLTGNIQDQLNAKAVKPATNCPAGQFLTYSNGAFTCAPETDPSVKAFAKNDLPACGTGEVLKSNGTSFVCVSDNAGAGEFTGPANRSVITGADGKLATSAITNLELNQLSGINTNKTIQTQINEITNNPSTGIFSGQALRLYESPVNGSNYVELRGADNITSNYVLKFPAGQGSNGQILSVNASGQLTWTSPSGMNLSLQDLTDVKNPLNPQNDQYLKFNGTEWVSSPVSFSEQDPSVMGFAKVALPSCGQGEVLKSNGTSFSCVADNAGAGEFSGPANRAVITGADGKLATSTVTNTEVGHLSGVSSNIQTQLAGKLNKPVANCGANEVLTLNPSGLTECVSVQAGVTSLPGLTDVADNLTLTSGNVLTYNGSEWTSLPAPSAPSVHNFALFNTTPPSCNSNQALRLSAGPVYSFQCVDIGAQSPVQSVSGRTGVVVLNQEGDIPQLNLIGDVNITNPQADHYLKFNGSQWISSVLNFNETDPSVMGFAKVVLPTCTTGQVLKSNGTSFECVTDNAGAGEFTGDPNKAVITGADGKLTTSSVTNTEVGYLSGVSSNIQTQLNNKTNKPAQDCGAGYVLTYNSGVLTCVQDEGGGANPLALNDLSDVTISSPSSGQALVFNGSQWTPSAINFNETDPTVEPFAQTALPVCNPNQVLAVTPPPTAGFVCVDLPEEFDPATLNAAQVAYDDSQTGLGDNVQEALDNLDSSKQDILNANSELHGQYVRLYGLNGVNRIQLQSPSGLNQNYNLTLPPLLPVTNGKILSVNTNGELSWADPFTPGQGQYTASQITNAPSGEISATNVQAAINELDSEKQSISGLASAVRAVLLTGLNTAQNAVITATDSILVAFGKLQGQINQIKSDLTDLTNSNNNKVTGPASSTNDALVRFNGSDGKVIKNSSATLTDAGALTVTTTNTTNLNIAGQSADARYLNTAGNESMSGNLEVGGQAYSTAHTVPTNGVNFDNGNVQVLPSVGGSQINLSNLKNGATYTLVVTDTTSRQYSFLGCNQTRFRPANAATESGKHTIYNILVVTDDNGLSICYISWATGW